MKKEDGRLRGMDGLRGVAIIAITREFDTPFHN